MDDLASKFQHITIQPVKIILHEVYKKILQNIPIMKEDVSMDEDIYGTSVQHLQGKIVFHKIQHVEPIIIPSVPKEILDRYNKSTVCCDIMHNNGIIFLNTIYRHIMFTTGTMIKNIKMKNTEDITK